jgi:signal transduction histidine kinase
LKHGALEDVKLRSELLDGMDETTGRLQRLLDELAALHEQVLGTLELNRQVVNLSQWLPALLAPYRESSLQKGLEWELFVQPGIPELRIDPDRIAQAVHNLVLNAIQFTPPGKKVSILAERRENQVAIVVKDQGLGIPAEERDLIWKPFYRGSNKGRFPQGMGLGLGIAREAIEAHDGSIGLDCPETGGCEFTISLPIT